MAGLVLLLIYVVYYLKKVHLNKTIDHTEAYDEKFMIKPTKEDPNPDPAFIIAHSTDYFIYWPISGYVKRVSDNYFDLSYLFDYNGSLAEDESKIFKIPMSDTVTYVLKQNILSNSNIVSPVYGCDVQISEKKLNIISTGKEYGFTQYTYTTQRTPIRNACILVIPYAVKKPKNAISSTGELTIIDNAILPTTVILVIFKVNRKSYKINENDSITILDKLPYDIVPQIMV